MKESSSSSNTLKVFDQCVFCFLYNKHVTVLKKRIIELGGLVEDDFKITKHTTHAVADPRLSSEQFFDKLDKKGIRVNPRSEKPVFVKPEWISKSIKYSKLIPSAKFTLHQQPALSVGEQTQTPQSDQEKVKKKQKHEVTHNKALIYESLLDAAIAAGAPFMDTEEEHNTEETKVDSPVTLSAKDSHTEAQDTLTRLRRQWTNNTIILPSGKESVLKHSPLEEQSLSAPGTNELVVKELNELVRLYKADGDKDGFRAKATKRAISILSRPPFGTGPGARQIQDASEILNTKHGGQLQGGIGVKTANKVAEILEDPEHHLFRVSMMQTDPMQQVLRMFTGLWGCGIECAQKWYAAGLRTLDDVSKQPNLSAMQILGIKYYDHLNKPIERADMERALATVRSAISEISCGEEVTACLSGSYRRGKLSTHDVDMLLFSKSYDLRGVMNRLVQQLIKIGFLLDHLAGRGSSNKTEGEVKSLMIMGIFKLPEGGKIGRVDLKVYHEESYAFAMLHCTGSADFNRALRYWCYREMPEVQKMLKKHSPGPALRWWHKKNPKKSAHQEEMYLGEAKEDPNALKLTDTALIPVYRAKRGKKLGDIVWEADPDAYLKCETEEEVFRLMGLHYVPPPLRAM